ncbi:MAG: OmpH family outer membrane protein [Planctomycetota bacterium]
MALYLIGLMATASLFTFADSAGVTKVAVVNIPVVSDQYKRTADLETHFDGLRVKFQQQRDSQKEKLERMAKSAQEELKPGTDEFRERLKQLAVMEAEMKWFVETEGRKIEDGLKGSLRSIFEDIQVVVRQVAEEKGMDVVLAADRLPDSLPDSPTQLRQQIILQKVLYWSPKVDITADVVARLNTLYETQEAAKAPAQAAQPDAQKPKKPDSAPPAKPGGKP